MRFIFTEPLAACCLWFVTKLKESIICMGNPNLQNNISFSSEWFLLCYILFREAKFILLCGWQFKGECWSILLLTNSEYFKCSQFLSWVLKDERWSHVSRVTLRCTWGSKSCQDEEVRVFCCLWFCWDVARRTAAVYVQCSILVSDVLKGPLSPRRL